METKTIFEETEHAVTSVVTDLTSSIKEASKTATNASNTLKALTEVLNVDPEKLKEALIMGALKDAAEGKEITYEGDFYKDLLGMVEKLVVDNKQLKKDVKMAEKREDKAWESLRQSNEKIYKAKKALEWPITISMFFGGGRVSKREANEALLNVQNQYNKVIASTYDALNKKD